jgi:hypothetical protein
MPAPPSKAVVKGKCEKKRGVAHTTSRSPATASLSTYQMEARENVTHGLPFYTPTAFALNLYPTALTLAM